MALASQSPRDSTARDYESLRREFRTNGFVCLRRFFSHDEVVQLTTDIRAAASGRSDADVLDVGDLKFHAVLMHKSAALRAFLAQPKIVHFLREFMGPDIWIRWDQAVEKRPGAGTFPWHQDNSYSGLRDPHFQFWIALTRMTAENGGIWLVPGSHRHRLPHRFEGRHNVHDTDGASAQFIAAEVGDVVLFSSLLLHSTTPNVTDQSRWAYVLEYMRGRDVDPFLPPPYLVVARGGEPALQYIDRQLGSGRLVNKLKYLRAHWRGETYAAKQKRGEAPPPPPHQ